MTTDDHGAAVVRTLLKFARALALATLMSLALTVLGGFGPSSAAAASDPSASFVYGVPAASPVATIVPAVAESLFPQATAGRGGSVSPDVAAGDATTTAGVLTVTPRTTGRLAQDIGMSPTAPRALPLNRPVGANDPSGIVNLFTVG